MKVTKLLISFIMIIAVSDSYGNEEAILDFFNKRIENLVSIGAISNEDVSLFEPLVGVKYYDNSLFMLRQKRSPLSVDSIEEIKKYSFDGEPRAMYYYALHHLFDTNNCKEGLHWLNKALDKKLVMAAVRKGMLHTIGWCGVEVSLEKRIYYYEIGFHAKEPESILSLAALREEGKYELEMPLTTSRLAGVSALLGHPKSQELTAELYYREGNYNEALGWYVLAYLQGINIPENVFKILRNEHGAFFSKQVRDNFKVTGIYRYYQFGYVDVYGGEEFF
jgi:TPR repeat protein